MSVKNTKTDNGPMLNSYPDSLGGTLGDVVSFLRKPELVRVFSSYYILPSLYHTDLDRGFSVIDYSLEQTLATEEDLENLKKLCNEVYGEHNFIANIIWQHK